MAPPPPASAPNPNLPYIVGFALFLGTLALYWRTGQFEFINLDDPPYVSVNPNVTSGLTADNIRWAFTTAHEANWHPLTWLSLQLDAALWGGLMPGGYHLTNAVLHAANAVLFFLAWFRMTGALWKSAFVGAAFAVHPLHVESVAWIAERKDVLSTLFWALAMLAYERYARGPTVGRYALVFAAMALGLMAKPMLVTLPFVFLLLDRWPLNRPAPLGRLLLEKVPLFALTVASSWVTFEVQQAGGATAYLGEPIPLPDRAANAVVAYAMYLVQAAVPVGLAPYYPYVQRTLADPLVLAAAGFLLLATGLVVAWARRLPFLAVGWFWFLGTLVPTVGVVQVGGQARADRYMYVPLIGLAVAVVWGVERLLAKLSAETRRNAAVGIAAVVLGGWAVLAWEQIGYWRTSQTLWTQTLAVTGDGNQVAQQNLGFAYADLSAAATGPADKARFAEAAVVHLTAGTKSPRTGTQVKAALGIALATLERDGEAEPWLAAAVAEMPGHGPARKALADVLIRRGDAVAALGHLKLLAPDATEPQVRTALGVALLRAGHRDAAEATFREAMRLGPPSAEVLTLLGLLLSDRGDLGRGVELCRLAAAKEPGAIRVHVHLGLALAAAGKPDEAKVAFAAADKVDPLWVEKADQAAWAAATAAGPPVGLIDAGWVARAACEATGYRQPRVVATLAAVEAAAGRFPQAVELAGRAMKEAQRTGPPGLVVQTAAELERYRAGKSLKPGS